jgi:hypothetical protein
VGVLDAVVGPATDLPGQEILNVPQRQRKPNIHHDRQADRRITSGEELK